MFDLDAFKSLFRFKNLSFLSFGTINADDFGSDMTKMETGINPPLIAAFFFLFSTVPIHGLVGSNDFVDGNSFDSACTEVST